jgi:hypothetical protein
MRTTRITLAVAGLAWALAGCGGYTIVKKSRLQPRRLPEDSVRIATLEAELAKLRIQREADSTRYADLVKEQSAPPPQSAVPANADTLLRARDLEIQTLRDQLAKLQAEMDRIKRRLASPRG